MNAPRDFNRAMKGYRSFQQLEPREVGTLAGLYLPTKLYNMGEAIHVVYRSDKWESRVHDYIHAHEGGVKLYRPDGANEGGRLHSVPSWIGSCETLYLLGKCLEFRYVDHENMEIDAKGKRPYPELYSIPSGKALLVVQVDGPKAKLLAAMWGGKLDVKDVGIVG